MAKRVCWSCGALTHMTRLTEPRNDARGYGGLRPFRHQAAFACDECETLSVGFVFDDQSVIGQAAFEQAQLHWEPSIVVGRQFPDVPDEIADAASEAHKCFSIEAYRASAALARSVVEATAKAKEITAGALYDKIEALHAAEHIRGHIKEAAHEIRHLGNEVAHGDFVVPVTREEAEEILVLMGEVLEEVFQSPARVAKRQAARKAKTGEA